MEQHRAFGEYWLFSLMEHKPTFLKQAATSSQSADKDNFDDLVGDEGVIRLREEEQKKSNVDEKV